MFKVGRNLLDKSFFVRTFLCPFQTIHRLHLVIVCITFGTTEGTFFPWPLTPDAYLGSDKLSLDANCSEADLFVILKNLIEKGLNRYSGNRPLSSTGKPVLVHFVYIIKFLGVFRCIGLVAFLFVNSDQQVIGIFQELFFFHFQFSLPS